MNTAIVVYHAPQMKNWRNIITDSLVRITALLCRYSELLREPDDDVRARRENDIGVLGRVRHTSARDAARDAADDGALLVAAQHATQHCAGARNVTYETLNVKVAGVRGFGAGFPAVTVPWTVEPAGITTWPDTSFTSLMTRAVKASPTLAVLDEIVSVAAMSNLVPTPATSCAGAAGGVFGRVVDELRCAGVRVGGVAGGFA